MASSSTTAHATVLGCNGTRFLSTTVSLQVSSNLSHCLARAQSLHVGVRPPTLTYVGIATAAESKRELRRLQQQRRRLLAQQSSHIADAQITTAPLISADVGTATAQQSQNALRRLQQQRRRLLARQCPQRQEQARRQQQSSRRHSAKESIIKCNGQKQRDRVVRRKLQRAAANESRLRIATPGPHHGPPAGAMTSSPFGHLAFDSRQAPTKAEMHQFESSPKKSVRAYYMNLGYECYPRGMLADAMNMPGVHDIEAFPADISAVPAPVRPLVQAIRDHVVKPATVETLMKAFTARTLKRAKYLSCASCGRSSLVEPEKDFTRVQLTSHVPEPYASDCTAETCTERHNDNLMLHRIHWQFLQYTGHVEEFGVSDSKSASASAGGHFRVHSSLVMMMSIEIQARA
jgi:hypothetical protein